MKGMFCRGLCAVLVVCCSAFVGEGIALTRRGDRSDRRERLHFDSRTLVYTNTFLKGLLFPNLLLLFTGGV